MASHALDRSLRRFDADGHMIVEMSHISKANICPYRGNEIPNWDVLGLDPQKVYKLFRDPEELAKAAHTFDGKPLLIRHVPITAELPQQSLWVGTVGKCTFEAPYLVTRPLTVITAEAHAAMAEDEQDELSAGYRYTAEMIPGVYGGEQYDGRMINIQGNHVALVVTGRAGPDVHVADETLPELRSMKHPTLIARLQKRFVALAGLSTADIIALDAELGEVPAKSVVTLDEAEDKACMDTALEEKRKMMGKDAELTEEEREKARSKAKDKKASDAAMKKEAEDKAAMDAAKTAKDAADKAAADQAAADAAAGGNPNHRKDFNSLKQGMDGKMGKDEALALVAAETAKARKEVREEQRALAIACDEVAPLCGRVQMHAFDTAEEVYAFALEKVGVDVDADFPKAGYRTLVKQEVSHRAAVTTRRVRHAGDSAGGSSGFDGDSLLQKVG